MKINIENLKIFLKNSIAHTYASGGKEITPQRPGFIELEYQEDDWYMRDSYVGHFQAPGMTVVYFQNKPVWTCAYGGKVLENYYGKTEEIFSFLKVALSQQNFKEAEEVPVRGPNLYEENDWKYTFDFEGDLKCFSGKEKIFFRGDLVFYQDVIGGIVIGKET